MRQLYSRNAALGVNEPGDPGEKLDMIVAPDSEISRTNPSFQCNGCGFRHNQAGAPYGSAPQVNQMPVVRKSIGTGIFTHG
jgi:hypothetical protein